MKIKLLASSAVLAGALMASGTANAGLVLEWLWTGTLNDWSTLGAVVDGDGDTTFTFDSTNFASSSNVALSEWEDDVTGADYYRVNVENLAGLGTGNSLRYNINSTHTVFDWAELDVDHLAVDTVVTKTLFDTAFTGPGFLTLTSNHGNSDSEFFGARSSFNVEDKIVTGNATGISNNYIPEPMSLSLFGLGLAALGYSRRNTMSKGLMA